MDAIFTNHSLSLHDPTLPTPLSSVTFEKSVIARNIIRREDVLLILLILCHIVNINTLNIEYLATGRPI